MPHATGCIFSSGGVSAVPPTGVLQEWNGTVDASVSGTNGIDRTVVAWAAAAGGAPPSTDWNTNLTPNVWGLPAPTYSVSLHCLIFSDQSSMGITQANVFPIWGSTLYLVLQIGYTSRTIMRCMPDGPGIGDRFNTSDMSVYRNGFLLNVLSSRFQLQFGINGRITTSSTNIDITRRYILAVVLGQHVGQNVALYVDGVPATGTPMIVGMGEDILNPKQYNLSMGKSDPWAYEGTAGKLYDVRRYDTRRTSVCIYMRMTTNDTCLFQNMMSIGCSHWTFPRAPEGWWTPLLYFNQMLING